MDDHVIGLTRNDEVVKECLGVDGAPARRFLVIQSATRKWRKSRLFLADPAAGTRLVPTSWLGGVLAWAVSFWFMSCAFADASDDYAHLPRDFQRPLASQ